MRNVADGATYTISSNFNNNVMNPFVGEPTEGSKFHTDHEANPWLLMDFGDRYLLREIVIYNRSDACQDRAETIQVEASVDGSVFDTLYRSADRTVFTGVRDGHPLRVKVTSSQLYRFIRFSLQEENYLHLDFIEIFSAPFWEHSEAAPGDGAVATHAVPAEAVIEPADQPEPASAPIPAATPPKLPSFSPPPGTGSMPTAAGFGKKSWFVLAIVLVLALVVAVVVGKSRN